MVYGRYSAFSSRQCTQSIDEHEVTMIVDQIPWQIHIQVWPKLFKYPAWKHPSMAKSVGVSPAWGIYKWNKLLYWKPVLSNTPFDPILIPLSWSSDEKYLKTNYSPKYLVIHSLIGDPDPFKFSISCLYKLYPHYIPIKHPLVSGW